MLPTSRLLDPKSTLPHPPRFHHVQGQCNDSYSAVVVAQALAGALKTDVNGLPLSIVLVRAPGGVGGSRILQRASQSRIRAAPSPPRRALQSWLEQKAVLVLLSLLHLGVKNIRIGPSLPAFVTPKTLDCEGRGMAVASRLESRPRIALRRSARPRVARPTPTPPTRPPAVLSKTFNLMPIAANATEADVDAVMGRTKKQHHA